MSAELDTAIGTALGYIRSLSGIKVAPTEPPEDMSNVWPFVVGYPQAGSFLEVPNGVRRGLHDIVIELHVSRNDLPTAYDLAIPYVDSIPNLLMSNAQDGWDGAISTFGEITYEFGALDWGDIKTMGVRFIVHDVKIQTAVS